MQYDQLYSFVISELENKLAKNLTYHNVSHTKNVIDNAIFIGEKEQISEHELTLLKSAALLHDVGFLENHLNHESLGCDFAKKHLPDFEYSAQEIDAICKMILATKLPQTPKNHLSEILCDADLFYIGNNEYEIYADKLFSEFKHNEILITQEVWHKRQIDFLNSHHFFTKTAVEEREAKKQENKNYLEYNLKLHSKKSNHRENLQDILSVMLGVIIAAFALKSFLVPNHFFDGGVTGLSLLIHELYDLNLALAIVIFNLPLIIISYFTVGKNFAKKTFLSVLFLGICLWQIPSLDITHDKIIVAIFGGAFLGIGVGLVMRAGAALDGIEVLALYTLKRTSFTITEIILGINIIIFGIAALKFGIETSLYSVLTYFAATKTIDYVVEGIQAFTGVTIISAKSEEIKYQLVNKLGRGITVYKGERGFLPGKYDVSADCDIIYTVITRLEMRKLKNLIYDIDPNAFVFANTIKEASGGIIKSRVKH
ncbi:MAG: YitT family protein [Chryseobacterium sp.]|nr:YitT family protein [Chryseobacterium sp.]